MAKRQVFKKKVKLVEKEVIEQEEVITKDEAGIERIEIIEKTVKKMVEEPIMEINKLGVLDYVFDVIEEEEVPEEPQINDEPIDYYIKSNL